MGREKKVENQPEFPKLGNENDNTRNTNLQIRMFHSIRQKARQSATTPDVAPLAISPRAPDVGEVVRGFDIADVGLMAVVSGLSFPIGYAIGKPIRTPAMWTMGGLGTVAGFLLAYQNSSGA